MLVWIVMGTTGEYSDREDWPVKGFRSLEKARSFADLAKKQGQELVSKSTGYKGMISEFEGKRTECDPNFRADYTGTDYFIYEVEIDDN